jgi:regulatory protein SWI6
MSAKQAQIDTIHARLREASSTLGIERTRLEDLKRQAKERDERKLKITNLRRAVDEERARLAQMQQQYGQPNGETEMRLGDADKGLAIPAGAAPENILSNINPNLHQPQVLDQAQRQLLASLPPTHVLRARVNAYKANNEGMAESIRGLQSKNSDLAAKYRKIISVCTGAEEDSVDGVLHNLLRAVESENDVELGRVREFLQRVDGV